jgi:hypothetical protein
MSEMKKLLLGYLRLTWACVVLFVGLNTLYVALCVTFLVPRPLPHAEFFVTWSWFMAIFLLVTGWQLLRAWMRERLAKPR